MEVKVFEPIGSFDEFCDIQRLKENVATVTEKTKIKTDVNMLLDELDMLEKEYERKYQEILDYISNYWGKFIHMKFSYNANYSDTRYKEPKWHVYYDVNVMPYYYVHDNQCLFGVYCVLDNNYRGGFEDKSIDLFKLVQEDRLEINEITEEEFLKTAEDRVFNCLKSRCDKIESGIYKLTKNGYG